MHAALLPSRAHRNKNVERNPPASRHAPAQSAERVRRCLLVAAELRVGPCMPAARVCVLPAVARRPGLENTQGPWRRAGGPGGEQAGVAPGIDRAHVPAAAARYLLPAISFKASQARPRRSGWPRHVRLSALATLLHICLAACNSLGTTNALLRATSAANSTHLSARAHFAAAHL